LFIWYIEPQLSCAGKLRFFVGVVFMQCRKLIDKLNREKHLDFPGWVALWSNYSDDDRIYAGELARSVEAEGYFDAVVPFSCLIGIPS
jgi:hypothetical protein